MPFIIMVLGAAAVAIIWYTRIRNATHMAGDVLDAANDVRLAARRFGYKWSNRSRHPIDTIEEMEVALAGTGLAFLQIDGLADRQSHTALRNTLAKQAGISTEAADECLVLAKWLIDQGNGPVQAIGRLNRRLIALGGADGFQRLMAIAAAIGEAQPNGLTERQKEELQDISRRYGIT